MSNPTTQLLNNPPKKLYFYVGIMDSFEGHKLKKLVPDETGYFNGIPMSAFHEKSFNGCYYEADSYFQHLTNANSVFNIKLRHGNLYGEWGHPKDDTNLKRVMEIDRDHESHHFRAAYVGKEAGHENIIYADLKPTGPKGPYLHASLCNPYENTAFSLRCIMTEAYNAQLRAPLRTVEEFITYDAVDMPGYIKGSKWFVEDATKAGRECLVPITLNSLYTPDGKRVGLEHFSDERILELFGLSNFDLNGKPLGSYIQGTNTYRDPRGINRSLTHSVLTSNLI